MNFTMKLIKIFVCTFLWPWLSSKHFNIWVTYIIIHSYLFPNLVTHFSNVFCVRLVHNWKCRSSDWFIRVDWWILLSPTWRCMARCRRCKSTCAASWINLITRYCTYAHSNEMVLARLHKWQFTTFHAMHA